MPESDPREFEDLDGDRGFVILVVAGVSVLAGLIVGTWSLPDAQMVKEDPEEVAHFLNHPIGGIGGLIGLVLIAVMLSIFSGAFGVVLARTVLRTRDEIRHISSLRRERRAANAAQGDRKSSS